MGTSVGGVATTASSSAAWAHTNNGLHIFNIDGMTVTPGADISLMAPKALYTRTAAGASWQGPMMFPDVTGRILRRDNTGKLYMATHNYASSGQTAGLYTSANGGQSWTNLTANIPVPLGATFNIWQLELSANNEIYILASVQVAPGNNVTQVYLSTNGGTSFAPVIQLPTAGFAKINNITVAPNGDLYFMGQSSLTFPSVFMMGHATNQGSSVASIPLPAFQFNTSSRVHVDRNNVPYLNSYDTLYKHAGSGNWTMLPPVVNGAPTNIKVYFDNTNDIYVVSKAAIHMSRNGGQSWTNISAGIPSFNGLGGLTMLSLTDLQFDANDSVYAYSTDIETAAAPHRAVYRFSGRPTHVASATVAEHSFSVYPNPAADRLNISWNDKQAGAELVIYDHTGRTVQRHQLDASNAAINIAALAPGMYFAELNTTTGRSTQQFVKQ